MKTSIRNKKGFTIVELVIVIAVIAILAAVLIPTFANLVEKANLSADEQAVRQMNTALKIYEAENDKPDSVVEAKKALDENLVNTESLTPVTQGYAFYWDKEENLVVLVGEGKATAEDDWFLLSSTGYADITETDNLETIKNTITASTNAKPAHIKLTNDITLTETLTISESNYVIMDLNEHTVANNGNDIVFDVKENATLAVKNGNVTAGGHCCVNNTRGDVTLQNVNLSNKGSFTATDGKMKYYPAVKIDGISNTAIIDCDLSSTDFDAVATNSEEPTSDGARLSIVHSNLKGKWAGLLITIYADVTISDNSTFEGEEHGAFFRGCNATISDSEFKHTTDGSAGAWATDGNKGPCADICFACGGNIDFVKYITSGTYKCSNVTASTVVIHQPEGGKVTVSGIEVDHRCTLGSGKTCGTDDDYKAN